MKKIYAFCFIINLLAFSNSNGQTAAYCSGTPQQPLPNDSITAYDVLIAQDSIHTLLYDEQTVWNGGMYLIERVLANPSLAGQNDTVDLFLAAHTDDNMYHLSLIRNMMNSYLHYLDSVIEVEMQSNLAVVHRNIEAIAYNDSILAYDSSLTEPARTTIVEENILRMDSVAQATESNRELSITFQSDKADFADYIQGLNGELSTEKVYEQNEITVNYIYLNMVSNTDFEAFNPPIDEATASVLYDVAIQCPLEGGPAVYRARALYSLYNRDTLFDNSACIDPCAGMPPFDTTYRTVCSDTVVFTPFDTTTSVAYFNLLYVIADTDTIYMDEPLTVIASGEEAYAEFHSIGYSCTEQTYINADFICSTNPPYVKVLWAYQEAGVNVTLGGEVGFIGNCGLEKHIVLLADTCNHLVTMYPPIDTTYVEECCSTQTYHSVIPLADTAYVRLLYMIAGTDTIYPEGNDTVMAAGENAFTEQHVVMNYCEEYQMYINLDIICNVSPPYISVLWCNEIEGTNVMLAVELGFVDACGAEKHVVTFADTCTHCGGGERKAGNPDDYSQYNDKGGNVEVFPNPTNGLLTVKFNSTEESPYAIHVTDLTGRILMEATGKSIQGTNYKDLNMGILSKGMYFISIRSETVNKVVRILKE